MLLIGLAAVIGGSVWFDVAGPVGEVISTGTHWLIGAGALILPVILVGINMMGIVSGKQILNSWRWVVMLIAIMSAMAAPGGEAITMREHGGAPGG